MVIAGPWGAMAIATVRVAGASILLGGTHMAFGIVQLLDADDNFVADFTTIQEAIDAASDGYTIVIGEGIYTEQIIVDGIDNLTITTDGGQVTVKAPADLVETAALIVGPGSQCRRHGENRHQRHDRQDRHRR